jgi:uncharacterized small protein (DUF1192 family)
MGELEDRERVARLEERVGLIHALVAEIRADQKQMAASISGAGGGFRMLMLMGGLAAVVGAVRGLTSWIAAWVPHGH